MTDHDGISRLFAEALSLSYDEPARILHLTFLKPDPKKVFELYAPSWHEHYDASMADAFADELRDALFASGEILHAVVKIYAIEPPELMDAVCDELDALKLPKDREIIGSWTWGDKTELLIFTWLVPEWFSEQLIEDVPDPQVFFDLCKAAFFDL